MKHKKVLLTIGLFLLLVTVFGQKEIDIKQHLQFFDLSFSSQPSSKFSSQNMTVKLTDYFDDTLYKSRISTILPSKSIKEIQTAINIDKISSFKKNRRVTFFSESDIFEKHKNFSYNLPPVVHSPQGQDSISKALQKENQRKREEYRLQQEQNAIREKKNTLSENEQVIYLFSNLYYDKTKTHCVFLVITSTVGNEVRQLFVYKRVKDKWTQIESIL